MKVLTEEKIIKVEAKMEELENEGLLSLMGQIITLHCVNYIYAGKLIGVNKTCIKLENAHLVFDTGPYSDSKFKDAQKLSDSYYIQIDAIESFGKMGNKSL